MVVKIVPPIYRKTQWDLPRWESSPSSEEEHPTNISGGEETIITTLSFPDVEEVRFDILVKCRYIF